ncbi:MAG: hypothetical protein JO255_10545 [Alphaproteobacteria bacterium]|nr:hypothetical protein [Alphaproteobacteria bacterium]
MVVLDCPATTEHPDSAALARHCDGTVLVVRAEGVRQAVIRASKLGIERMGGQILGVVLNRRRKYIPEWLYRSL